MASGSFSNSILSGHYKLLVEWSSTPNTANNRSSVNVKAYLVNDWSLDVGSRTGEIIINGNSNSYSASGIQTTGTHKLGEATNNVNHNSDGKKSITISVTYPIKATIRGTYYASITATATVALDNIPRYATVSQTLQSKTETTATIKWTADSTIDYIWYSSNNGSSWTGVDVADGTSGSYTISGLAANTTYNIKTRVRRKDSQLTTDSSALPVTTYNYPYANSMPNFTIGDKLTLGFYNPLGREFTFYIIANGTQIANHWTISGTSYSGVNADSSVNQLYATIPNAKSATYKVKCVYDSNTITKTGGTFSVKASACSPSIESVAYQDTNSSVTAITQNNQQIVRNRSTVGYTASGLAAQKSATVASCKVVVNGNTYNLTINGTSATGGNAAIDSGSNVTAVFTVTDSRGLTASKSVTVTMLDWYLPSAIITLARQNNFYSETDITVDAIFASVNSKNAITITYKAKKAGTSSWTVTGTLSDNVLATFTADNNYAWDVQVVLTDRFGTTTYNLTLSRGMPIAFFDRLKRSFSIGCFPQDEDSLEVLGKNIYDALYFKNGDTLTLNQIPVNGFVTSSAKTVNLLVSVGKSLADISSISVTACKGGIRTAEGGYLNSGSDSSDWKNTSGITISATKVADHYIKLRIQSTSAFTNVTNNTPLSLWCNPVTFAFSA